MSHGPYVEQGDRVIILEVYQETLSPDYELLVGRCGEVIVEADGDGDIRVKPDKPLPGADEDQAYYIRRWDWEEE